MRIDRPDHESETRQVNPEFIVNIDAGAIVMFQVLISFLMAKFHRFTTMIIGMLVAAVGIGAIGVRRQAQGMIGLGGSVWIVAARVVHLRHRRDDGFARRARSTSAGLRRRTRRRSTWATTSWPSRWATCSAESSPANSTERWPGTCSGRT